MRNDEYVAEIITTLASQDCPEEIWADGFNAICWTVRHAKAHPALRNLGKRSLAFNIERGYTDPTPPLDNSDTEGS